MGACALAWKRAGLPLSRYMASEIDVDAVRVASVNHLEIEQLGDIRRLNASRLPCQPDIVTAGSPCQGFSFAGKTLNFTDPRSALFFEFVRLLKQIKPPYFLLENVPMQKRFQNIISDYMGVDPVEINSSLVSAQNRRRLYWTNIPIALLEDRGVTVQDILEDVSLPYPATVNRNLYQGEKVMCLRVKQDTTKSYCLTSSPAAVQTDQLPGQYPFPTRQKYNWRPYTLKEMCRLQTLPDNYFYGVANKTRARRLIGNGWTVDVIAHIFAGIH